MLYNEDNNNISNFDIILKICINNAITLLLTVSTNVCRPM